MDNKFYIGQRVKFIGNKEDYWFIAQYPSHKEIYGIIRQIDEINRDMLIEIDCDLKWYFYFDDPDWIDATEDVTDEYV